MNKLTLVSLVLLVGLAFMGCNDGKGGSSHTSYNVKGGKILLNGEPTSREFFVIAEEDFTLKYYTNYDILTIGRVETEMTYSASSTNNEYGIPDFTPDTYGIFPIILYANEHNYKNSYIAYVVDGILTTVVESEEVKSIDLEDDIPSVGFEIKDEFVNFVFRDTDIHRFGDLISITNSNEEEIRLGVTSNNVLLLNDNVYQIDIPGYETITYTP